MFIIAFTAAVVEISSAERECQQGSIERQLCTVAAHLMLEASHRRHNDSEEAERWASIVDKGLSELEDMRAAVRVVAERKASKCEGN